MYLLNNYKMLKIRFKNIGKERLLLKVSRFLVQIRVSNVIQFTSKMCPQLDYVPPRPFEVCTSISNLLRLLL